MYPAPVGDLHVLAARNTKKAIKSVTREMRQNTWREIKYRFDVLRATKKAHVKTY